MADSKENEEKAMEKQAALFDDESPATDSTTKDKKNEFNPWLDKICSMSPEAAVTMVAALHGGPAKKEFFSQWTTVYAATFIAAEARCNKPDFYKKANEFVLAQQKIGSTTQAPQQPPLAPTAPPMNNGGGGKSGVLPPLREPTGGGGGNWDPAPSDPFDPGGSPSGGNGGGTYQNGCIVPIAQTLTELRKVASAFRVSPEAIISLFDIADSVQEKRDDLLALIAVCGGNR